MFNPIIAMSHKIFIEVSRKFSNSCVQFYTLLLSFIFITILLDIILAVPSTLQDKCLLHIFSLLHPHLHSDNAKVHN